MNTSLCITLIPFIFLLFNYLIHVSACARRVGNTWISVNASGAWSGRAEFSEVSNGFRVSLTVPSPVPVLSLRPVGPGELYFGDSILPLVLSDALPNFGND